MRFFRLMAITVLLLACVVLGSACAGAKGADGVGIQSIANNTDGSLTIYLTNGQSYTTRDLTGPQGEKGDIGATGAAGTKGDTGATGVKGDKGDIGVGLSPSYATVATYETTYDNLTSGSLPTVGPSVAVTIGTSGSALVTLTTGIQAYMNCFGYMGFAVSGGPMNSSQLVGGGTETATTTFRSGATFVVTGLNPGVNTFTARYTAVLFHVAGYVAFFDRSIIVQPL